MVEICRFYDSDGFKHINQYRVIAHITEGNFCRINLCEANEFVHPSSSSSIGEGSSASLRPRLFVLKSYRKSELARKKHFNSSSESFTPRIQTQLDFVKTEIKICRIVNSEYCVKTEEVIDEKGEGTKLYIVMEHLMFGAVMRSRSRDYQLPLGSSNLDEDVAKWIILCTLRGIIYLHSLGICHRDIKPDNIFLSSDGIAKIGDFGTSEFMDGDGFVRKTKGTYALMAPECLHEQEEGTAYHGHDGKAADVWAVGMTTWALLFGWLPSLGRPPTEQLVGDVTRDGCEEGTSHDSFTSADLGESPFGNNEFSLAKLFVIVAEANYRFPNYPSISIEAKDFISSLLNKDVKQRFTTQQALAHPWLRSASKEPMLRYVKELQDAKIGEVVDSSNSATSPVHVNTRGGEGLVGGGAVQNGKRRWRVQLAAPSLADEGEEEALWS